tara:strand:+ start:397 stop:828 length:432 start_codon:yes stop_codon:yes gene_type:complete
MDNDEQNLKLLSIFHYVLGGMAGLFALLPIFHLIIGLVFVLMPESFDGEGKQEAAVVGWIFIVSASVIILIGWMFAAFIIMTGRAIAQRRRYHFCLVMAGIECLFMPFGTVLGVFTIIVLVRDSVKGQFEGQLPVSVPASIEE